MVLDANKTTHLVIKVEDAQKHLSESELGDLFCLVGTIHLGRVSDGKTANNYYIVNQDEPYSDEVQGIIAKYESNKID